MVGTRVSLRRRLWLSGVAAAGVVAAMLGGASSAQATTCVFSNAAAGPITPGAQGWIEDVSDLNVTDTDSGTYAFSTMPPGGLVCTPPGLSGTLTSNGQYTNVLCGTGRLGSSASAGNSTRGGGILSADYTIDYTDGHGTLDFQVVNGVPQPLPKEGEVEITPTQPAPPGVPCVTGRETAFEMQGWFTYVP